jgi:hypothetical protein
MSVHRIAVTIDVTCPPESEREVSAGPSVNPASVVVGKPTYRPMRVPAACAAHSLARRRAADALHVVGREQGGAA